MIEREAVSKGQPLFFSDAFGSSFNPQFTFNPTASPNQGLC